MKKGKASFLRFGLLGIASALIALTAVPLMAGSAPIGVIARSADTSIGSIPAQTDTTLFSGDVLRVEQNGLAIVNLLGGSQMALDSGSVAAFSKGSGGVNVNLDHGDLSLFHPGQGQALRVRAAGVSVEPVGGEPSKGQVAWWNGRLTVTAQAGRLRVEGNGFAKDAAPNDPVTMTVSAANGSVPATALGPAQGAAAGGSHLAWIAGIGAAGAGAIAGATAISSKGQTASGSSVSSANNEQGNATTASANAPPPPASNSSSSSGSSSAASPASGFPANGRPNGPNPTAVSQVAAHAPPPACANAASPSIPAIACGSGH